MVPWPIAPLTQGGIDQMTTSLARENRLMDLVQGPAPGHLGAKFGDGRSAVRARAQVEPFIGIGRQVVELVRICRRVRSEEHTSELQSQSNLVCRLLLEKKKKTRCAIYVCN